jgi:hypothetical protein
VLEILRSILEAVRTTPDFVTLGESKYRARALGQHLASVPLLQGLSPAFIDRLRSNVKFVACEPGTVIFKQDDPRETSDGLY